MHIIKRKNESTEKCHSMGHSHASSVIQSKWVTHQVAYSRESQLTRVLSLSADGL